MDLSFLELSDIFGTTGVFKDPGAILAVTGNTLRLKLVW